MTKSAMATDLGKHLQQQIGEVLSRHHRAAQVVLEPTELAIMLVEAAVSVMLTVACTSASAIPEDLRAQFFVDTVDMIANCARRDRDRALVAVAAAAKQSEQ